MMTWITNPLIWITCLRSIIEADITRNPKDFSASTLPIMSTEKYLTSSFLNPSLQKPYHLPIKNLWLLHIDHMPTFRYDK